MALQATLFSIVLSFFSIHQLKAQQGLGCVYTTCTQRGQVRINAIVDPSGNYLGGCYCGCDPALYDPFSAKYCAPPNVVSFNYATNTGDCSCLYPNNNNPIISQYQYATPTTTTTKAPTMRTMPDPYTANTGSLPYYTNAPQLYIPPPIPILPPLPTSPPTNRPTIYVAPTPHPTTAAPTNRPTTAAPTNRPTIYMPPTTKTPTNRPTTASPTTAAPTIYVPPRPITAVCDGVGPCGCPMNHVGECTILCEGGTGFACNDALIECNNNGYPCFVQCNDVNACGRASIMGPVDSALTVSCAGGNSCGFTQINGAAGTDVTVTCDGGTSCNTAVFNMGAGMGRIECNGDPEACTGAVFNLLLGSRYMAGASFACVGPECPSTVPESFSNIYGLCAEAGVGCLCYHGLNQPCKLTCDGSTDSCKDAMIACNSDGFDCVVDCIAPNSCSGASVIMGPVGAALTVNCIGHKSCEGATVIDAALGTDLTVNCGGSEACKGSVEFNFGVGVGAVVCSGYPDSCLDATFNILPNAASIPGMAFSCIGSNCPVEPQPFNNAYFSPVIPVQPVYPNPIPVPVQPVYVYPIPTPMPTMQTVVAVPSSVICSDRACSCAAGSNGACLLTCDGQVDACKDGVIVCNSNGFDCVVDCVAMNACSGAAVIRGPVGAALTVNCIGPKSCEGSTIIDGTLGTDLTVNCYGRESCKGSVEFNFGAGVGAVTCSEYPDSCQDAAFNLNSAAAFSCSGSNCPAQFRQPPPMAPTQPIQQILPTQPSPIPPIQPIQPIQTQSIQPIQSIQPPPVPTVQSPYCCLTSIPNFAPWQGRCWDGITAAECVAKPNGRCIWDAANCLANPPVNTLANYKACAFRDALCMQHSDCCSETCNADLTCR